jgi:hypothetical protein
MAERAGPPPLAQCRAEGPGITQTHTRETDLRTRIRGGSGSLLLFGFLDFDDNVDGQLVRNVRTWPPMLREKMLWEKMLWGGGENHCIHRR